LIKTTLRFLYGKTRDDHNKLNIFRLLYFFSDVDYSTAFDADFSKSVADRSMSHYAKALSWCKVFLRGNSFTTFTGSEVAIALLFPMEKVFESYVAAKLRQHISNDFELRTQDKRHSLFDLPTKAFGLCPDIVLMSKEKVTVMDTKWKILSGDRNYGISQADMYQMYAYSKKYNAEKTVLVYPLSGNLSGDDISFQSNDKVNVEIFFIDLFQPDVSVPMLISR
jgi:5-methylcytosine-specific restriction enzyme subunit McrC